MNMQTTTEHNEAVEKLSKLIKGIKIAMLTTLDADGTLRSRPMATQEQDFTGQLWFFTAKDSPKVDEINAEHEVNLSYAEPSHNRYVSISGKGILVNDKVKAKELWTPAMKVWFPKGLDDPELMLLMVTPSKAEYWDSPSSVMLHVYGFVKATLTGESPKPGGHAKVDLRP